MKLKLGLQTGRIPITVILLCFVSAFLLKFLLLSRKAPGFLLSDHNSNSIFAPTVSHYNPSFPFSFSSLDGFYCDTERCVVLHYQQLDMISNCTTKQLKLINQ